MNIKSLSNEVHLYHASLTTEKPVFADEADKYNFLTMFGKRTRVYGLHAAGFCLLDQAVHIMIDMEASGITGADLLKECFENDFCSYYQKRHQTYHQLGSSAYDGRIGSPAEEISWLSRLHMLPVWCGIVQKPEDYWWTSWQTYRDCYNWDFLDCTEALALFSLERASAVKRMRERQQKESQDQMVLLPGISKI